MARVKLTRIDSIADDEQSDVKMVKSQNTSLEFFINLRWTMDGGRIHQLTGNGSVVSDVCTEHTYDTLLEPVRIRLYSFGTRCTYGNSSMYAHIQPQKHTSIQKNDAYGISFAECFVPVYMLHMHNTHGKCLSGAGYWIQQQHAQKIHSHPGIHQNVQVQTKANTHARTPQMRVRVTSMPQSWNCRNIGIVGLCSCWICVPTKCAFTNISPIFTYIV